MDSFKEACIEIVKEIKKNNVSTQHQLNQIKLKILNKYKTSKVNQVPKNADIYFAASEEDRQLLKDLLSLKPVRTISGVAPIAIMSEPYPCPHTMKGIGPCSYCPGGPGSVFGNVPQSYTGKEPSTRRAIRNNYDPYLIVFNRLEHYVAMGKIPDKVEIIIQGGTFTFFPKAYQEYFVKYALKAMNDFSKLFFPRKFAEFSGHQKSSIFECNESGNIDILKFKKFFELPRILNEEDKRIKNIQQKLLHIKNLDLSNRNNFEKIEDLFFGDVSFENGVNENFIDLDNGKNANNGLLNIEKGKNVNIEKIGNNASGDEQKNNQNETTVSAQNASLKLIENKTEDSNILAIKNIQNILENQRFSGHQKSEGFFSELKIEDNKNLTLKQVQKENETSFIRCVGLTIETKSDFGKLYHGNLMLGLGCTRVEIGIQSIYDNVLEATNRGNTVKDNIESIRILKDLGFKINMHYMPGLPLTTKGMDLNGLRQLFENSDYMPDMLKIYPCMVMGGTKLYDDWKNGKFKPLTTKEAAELIAEAKRFVPKWCRIMRVQRDIPSNITSAGVDRTNLRQYVEEICKEREIKCRCIRCREVGFYLKSQKSSIFDDAQKAKRFLTNNNKKIDFKNIQTTITEYEASKGKEFFIAAEDLKNDILFGFCRLRFPSQSLREEITKNSALVRELHVFSQAAQIGKKNEESFQHRGIGKSLMKKAEEIAKQNNKDKMVVISGIGAREYFRKIGYELEELYMVKRL